jgi:hypothetical protein
MDIFPISKILKKELDLSSLDFYSLLVNLIISWKKHSSFKKIFIYISITLIVYKLKSDHSYLFIYHLIIELIIILFSNLKVLSYFIADPIFVLMAGSGPSSPQPGPNGPPGPSGQPGPSRPPNGPPSGEPGPSRQPGASQEEPDNKEINIPYLSGEIDKSISILKLKDLILNLRPSEHLGMKLTRSEREMYCNIILKFNGILFTGNSFEKYCSDNNIAITSSTRALIEKNLGRDLIIFNPGTRERVFIANISNNSMKKIGGYLNILYDYNYVSANFKLIDIITDTSIKNNWSINTTINNLIHHSCNLSPQVKNYLNTNRAAIEFAYLKQDLSVFKVSRQFFAFSEAERLGRFNVNAYSDGERKLIADITYNFVFSYNETKHPDYWFKILNTYRGVHGEHYDSNKLFTISELDALLYDLQNRSTQALDLWSEIVLLSDKIHSKEIFEKFAPRFSASTSTEELSQISREHFIESKKRLYNFSEQELEIKRVKAGIDIGIYSVAKQQVDRGVFRKE